MIVIHQSGVVPYRICNNQVEILLITSSKQKHWILPKGWIDPWLSAADSAAKEAREEAGVLGSVRLPAIGAYSDRKWGLPCRVDIFLMQVETVLEDWAESKIRQRQWMSVAEAIASVKKAELKQLLETVQGANIQDWDAD